MSDNEVKKPAIVQKDPKRVAAGKKGAEARKRNAELRKKETEAVKKENAKLLQITKDDEEDVSIKTNSDTQIYIYKNYIPLCIAIAAGLGLYLYKPVKVITPIAPVALQTQNKPVSEKHDIFEIN